MFLGALCSAVHSGGVPAVEDDDFWAGHLAIAADVSGCNARGEDSEQAGNDCEEELHRAALHTVQRLGVSGLQKVIE